MGIDPTVSQREIGSVMQLSYDNCVAVKAVVVAFNKEKALVGAFSMIMNLRVDLFAF